MHATTTHQVQAKYFEEMRFYSAQGSSYVNFGFAADPAETRKWGKKPLKDEGAVVHVHAYVAPLYLTSHCVCESLCRASHKPGCIQAQSRCCPCCAHCLRLNSRIPRLQLHACSSMCYTMIYPSIYHLLITAPSSHLCATLSSMRNTIIYA